MLIENDPTRLSPALHAIWLEVCARVLRERGWHLFFTQTHRDQEAQALAFSQGKSRARWGESWHNLEPALALDFAVVSDFTKIPTRRWSMPGAFDWDERKLAFVGRVAEQCGLVWGGRFTGVRDLPHLQGPAAAAPGESWHALSPSGREARVAEEIASRQSQVFELHPRKNFNNRFPSP